MLSNRAVFALILAVAYTYGATVFPTFTTHHVTHHTTHAHGNHTTHAHGNHTTHAQHMTTEHNEKESWSFVYEATTHQMVMHRLHTCYIFTLTPEQQKSVHTNHGILDLEIQLIGMLSTGTQTNVTANSVDPHLKRACGASIFKYIVVS
ncbi:uncharacterized protein LOC127862055 [Dreissena polymorpha]|uniref:Uncharacterized protein n=1 Tax=Dreissena polymorpha TaxID=45954 RepID=A0A9D3YGQ3_DREPO|nr:uncharacterized protein LOC127862055 [Dreissena polymorpha]KAH3697819.1 hypothetical protein DPMN_085329 [Dreissena polymorpha]